MDAKVISRNIGIALLLNALFMLISAFVSLLYGFDASFTPLILSALITSLVGVFPLIFVSDHIDINLREGFTIVVMAWIISCLFGMLPYLMYGGEFSIIDSWFESVSGYTTTGSTSLSNIEALPKGLLFWRSSTHWLGGLGVVVFMLLVLPTASSFRMKLSKMEISSLSKENFRYKVKQTIRIITTVYLSLTLFGVAILVMMGMNLFDAVNHSFSAVATGGFSTKNSSILYFNSFGIELALMLLMVMSSIHFGLLFSFFTGSPGNIFKSPVVRFYLASIFVVGLFVSLNIKHNSLVVGWGDAFRQGYFQVISLVSTTGFATSDTSIWPPFSILLLTYMMFQCACSGSTAGGLKVDRIFIFLASIRAHLKRQIHPNAVVPIRLGKHVLDRDVVSGVNLFIGLYVLIVFVSALMLSLNGMNTLEAFSASASSMANAGPGFGTIGSLGNYSLVAPTSKFILTIQMLLGRLEIYPIMLMFVVFRSR